MFCDVDRIKDLDWCGYLLRSLVAAHGYWTQDRTRKFTGPLLFLILLYADRVVVGGRDVPRSIPTLNGWTTGLLKARETRDITAQGFGQGLLDDPPHPTDFHAPSVEAPLSGQPVRLSTEPGTLQPGLTVGTPQRFTQLFESKTGDLVLVATQVADMVRQNPYQAYGDHNFKRLAKASNLLQRVAQNELNATHCSGAQKAQTPGHTKMDQEEVFWQNSDNIKALERAEMAALRANTISDMPSFSMGFTQDDPAQGNDDHPPISDMPSFSLGFTQDYPTQGNDDHRPIHQGPVTPAPHDANRGMQSEDLLLKNQESPAPPVLTIAADRKGKQPLNQEARPFRLLSSLVRGYPTVPIPPIYMVGTVVDTTGTRDERIELFKARLDVDLRASHHVRTATLDMDGHYYVMSVNFNQYKFDIIDCNSKQMPNDKKYRDAPVDLLDMLSEYVESKRQWA
nr:uncharacterized protein LOC109157732 isoform X3 [Ipomoea batatas]